ncbi:hypothetical protein N6H18_12535 [Reichenbachiella agarivorans]|uniref:Uncharacterized protein n=1 Tax=Reichenbachiella agarivorans TaxID=2979464 RepID=A0ABY6CKX3_9BACT|nr:hypothetical protein [Reichenbachiella agarivorans]UXP31176.1 hypothetical protein N6H18_12535 [Reichenbachiella agarivorans]
MKILKNVNLLVIAFIFTLAAASCSSQGSAGQTEVAEDTVEVAVPEEIVVDSAAMEVEMDTTSMEADSVSAE